MRTKGCDVAREYGWEIVSDLPIVDTVYSGPFCCREMEQAIISGFAAIRDGVAVYGEVSEEKSVCPDGSVFIVRGNRGIRARRCLFCGGDLPTNTYRRVSE